jgi:DNA-binding transcriptional LysR family regulator
VKGWRVIDEYVLFATVVEAGSLSGAGRRLRLSPAMVSKRLARLEERLGATLIHRTTRRLATTDAGQQFYERIVVLLAEAQAAERAVTGRAGRPGGRLRVAAPTSFGRLHVAPYLRGFLDAYPDVRMELVLQDGFNDLLGDRIDLAIRITAPVDKSLDWRLLCANHRVLCASADYVARHGAPTSLADLTRHPLLAADGQLPWRLQGPEGMATVDGESCVRTNSSEVVRELALAGLGVALRSHWDVSRQLENGALIRLLTDHQGAADVGVYAVFPKTSLVMANVEAFAAYLGQLYASPPWGAFLVGKRPPGRRNAPTAPMRCT